jgi:hypothetical protein
MTILFSILLVALIAVESAQFYHNFYTVRHSMNIYRKNAAQFEEQNIQLRKENMRLKDMLDDISADKFDTTAFALTAEGLKLLPKDWQERLK